ncbi:hypothetical protein FRB99_003410 [Tulasnella sp. 403]|nr:hypothetical protein FRB99_003410 [Tulasnella sp. 403]
MSSSFDVSAFVYGAEGTRVELDLVIPITPAPIANDAQALTMYAQRQVIQVSSELKYNFAMTCEFCGKPARENYQTAAPWTHLPPKGQMWNGKPSPGPFVNLYIHAVCSMSGECGKAAIEHGKVMAAMPSFNTPQIPIIPETDHIFPPNGACARCQDDESMDEELMKCGQCKTIRYCSQDCQKADWKRHKKTCQWIKGIRYVGSSNT